MDEKKFVEFKKEELSMKRYIHSSLGKGKISSVRVEYTPIGEKIIISTDRPGIIIGSRGERINELTSVLKTRFKLENPHIEIEEIRNPYLDARLVADRIALEIERFGNLRFKKIAYKELTKIRKAGALGAEIRLGGKLPSDRAKVWRFSEGYLKKVGESSKIVEKANSVALTKLGITGIKVSILPPGAFLYDKIEITDEVKQRIKQGIPEEIVKNKKTKKLDKEKK